MSNVSKIGSADLAHLLRKARDAANGGPGGMSAGEQLAVALILDRPDWLAARNCTIADAMERVGPDWLCLIPVVARQLRRDHDEAADAAAQRAKQASIAHLVSHREADEVIDVGATLVNCGDAPGYRDVHLTFDLVPIGQNSEPTIRASIRIRPEDGERIVSHVTGVHRFAWDRSGRRPIDAAPDEQRPTWIDP